MSLMPPTAAEFYLETVVDSLILLRKINESTTVSNYYLALRAEFKFETEVFFMVLRSKIMKNTSVSKEYSAAEGGKNFFAAKQHF